MWNALKTIFACTLLLAVGGGLSWWMLGVYETATESAQWPTIRGKVLESEVR